MRTPALFRGAPFALGLWLSCVLIAHAHDPGLSTLRVQLRRTALEATLVLSAKDAQGLAHPSLDRISASEVVEFRCNGELLRTELIGWQITGSNAIAQLRCPLGPLSTLAVHSTCFPRLPAGHRQFVTVQNSGGEMLAQKLLSAGSDEVTLRMTPDPAASSPSPGRAFADFLSLGVKHILTGYDHLLFLLTLLLATKTVAESLKIITAFTVAHSITLALAALNIVRVPAGLVEPIIAASILYVAVENLWRRDSAKRRGLVTFAFGLVHGLGFASALREAGLGAGPAVLVPLVSFNLGVELGQLVVAGVALPLLWQLSARPVFIRRLMPAGSVLIAAAGAAWLIQRLWLATR